MSVKLQPAPKCETPAPFRGVLLKKLKIGLDLHCDTPLQPLLELRPDQDQVICYFCVQRKHWTELIFKHFQFNS